jgi:hypothetical protein
MSDKCQCSNRWGIKPEIGASHRQGRLFYEGYAGIWFYTENNQYYNNSTLSQKALFSFQAHVDYTFKHGKYFSMSTNLSNSCLTQEWQHVQDKIIQL